MQYIQFLTCFLGGEGGGEEGATKVSQKLTKVSRKFWQNFMTSKFQKNHNTSNNGVFGAIKVLLVQ